MNATVRSRETYRATLTSPSSNCMKDIRHAALASLPVLLPLMCWKAAYPIAEALGCHENFKVASGCIADGNNWEPLLGLLWLMGAMLWIPGLLIAGLLIGGRLRDRLPRPWGSRVKRSRA